MNETLKIIAQRFSCRKFTGQMPDGKDIEAIAQAAIQAPSAMNRQQWQIIVVKNKELMAAMDEEGLRILHEMDDQTLYERILSRGGKLFYNAPCMIVIAIKESPYPKGAELLDCGIVAQNISLAATSLGLASVHCGFAGLAFAADRADEFKNKLKFAEGYEFGLAVLLGYAKETAAPHVPDQSKITVVE